MVMGAPSVFYDVALAVPGEVIRGHALADRVDALDLALAVMLRGSNLFLFAELGCDLRRAIGKVVAKLLQRGWRWGFDVALDEVLNRGVIHTD